jgi:hypothetical protein
VPDPDPFTDAAFVSRTQKLLSMIGSGQAAEAEAARRKLLEHLTHHRLSLTDLAARIGGGPRPGAPPSVIQGARDLNLERQLVIARSARQEAEAEASVNRARLTELQAILHQANIDMARLLNSQSRLRYVTAAACGVAATCLIIAALSYLPAQSDMHQKIGVLLHDGPVSLRSQGQAPAMPIRTLLSERVGQVAVQDLTVRLAPSDDAGVRAFLNQGERVLIMEQRRVGPQSWLRIRSETGEGWVRSGDILH